MEQFTRVDIFDTKGMEYLMVIGYLLVLILFWQIARNPQRIVRKIREAVSTLSEKILRIPLGIFFNRNHTWTHLNETGEARVGLDDFLQHVTGQVRVSQLKVPGDMIQKGGLLTEIEQDGKHLKIYSPISGEILQTNSILAEDPGLLNQDPYDKGWIYKVKPADWKRETSSCMLAEEAVRWSEKEFVRFKDFLTGGPMKTCSSEPSMVLLQDGGEIRENILSDLPGEVWESFQEEFLDLK